MHLGSEFSRAITLTLCGTRGSAAKTPSFLIFCRLSGMWQGAWNGWKVGSLASRQASDRLPEPEISCNIVSDDREIPN